MRALIAAALTAVLAGPAVAQEAKITEAATIISSIEKNEAKRKTYCELQDLLTRAEEAASKNDETQAKTLSNEAEAKSQTLGEEFQKLTALEADIDPKSDEGVKYLAAWESLEKSCAKS
jgi:hypothetical protein